MNKRLLIEGPDDHHVIKNLIKREGIKHDIVFEQLNGVDEVLAGLPIRIKTNLPFTIGIVIDANSDILSRWRRVKEILQNEGYVIPEEPIKEGAVISKEPNQTIGIWLMPNNEAIGMLEDFMKVMVPNKNPAFSFAEVTISELEKQNLHSYQPQKHSKALIHTWLAWQEDPGTPLGWAITKKYFDTNHQLVTDFLGWVNRLFTETNH